MKQIVENEYNEFDKYDLALIRQEETRRIIMNNEERHCEQCKKRIFDKYYIVPVVKYKVGQWDFDCTSRPLSFCAECFASDNLLGRFATNETKRNPSR